MTSQLFSAQRLIWIRRKRGITKKTLAERVGVSVRTISAYENEEFPPQGANLNALANALGVQADYFFQGPMVGPEPDQASFRSFSKLSAAKRDMALGSGAIAFEFSTWLENGFDLPVPQLPDLREFSPEEAAVSLRMQWGLGERPVSNMIHLLESKGVRVFSLALDMDDVDAFCTWRDSVPFVFLNLKKSGARRRFDAAHELGHLVLHRHGDYDGRGTEREADAFASAFLMPRDGFLASAPRLPNISSVITAKAKWGVSVAAYVMRLYQLNVLSDWHYRTLFKQLSQRGYRKQEPQDAAFERSQLLEKVLTALRGEGMSVSQVAGKLGLNSSDLTELMFDLATVSLEGAARTTGRRTGHLSLIVNNTDGAK